MKNQTETGLKTGLKKSPTKKTGLKTEQKNIVLKKANIVAKEEETILNLITTNSKITRIELADSVGLTEQAIQRRIDKLVKEGRLSRMGPKKGGYWVIQ